MLILFSQVEDSVIEVYRIFMRYGPQKNYKTKCDYIKFFAISTGHGTGSIDFMKRILVIPDSEYQRILEDSGEYAQFKLGNINKFTEIEIFPEHAQKLVPELPECDLKGVLSSLKEGLLILRKSNEVSSSNDRQPSERGRRYW